MKANENTNTQHSADFKEMQHEAKKSMYWKPVTIGGVTGILMGVGTYLGFNTTLTPDESQPQAQLKTADNHDELSFADAFAAARHQVGAGGLFTWHGGIYNTYTQAEWNAMNSADKEHFAQQVKPEVGVSETLANKIEKENAESQLVEANTDETSETEVVTFGETASTTAEEKQNTEEVEIVGNDDVQIVAETQQAEVSDDVEVQIIGTRQVLNDDGSIANVAYATVDGHSAIIIDVNANGHADVAAVDMNDNKQLDKGEVIDLYTGREFSTGTDTAVADNNQMTTEDDGSMDAGVMDTEFSLI